MDVRIPIILQRISETYEAIAQNIQTLVHLLNEPGTAHDQETKALAQRISKFLIELEQSIIFAERKHGREHRGRELLSILDVELRDLQKMGAYIGLAAHTPRPEFIQKIHELSAQISREMQAMRRVA